MHSIQAVPFQKGVVVGQGVPEFVLGNVAFGGVTILLLAATFVSLGVGVGGIGVVFCWH